MRRTHGWVIVTWVHHDWFCSSTAITLVPLTAFVHWTLDGWAFDHHLGTLGRRTHRGGVMSGELLFRLLILLTPLQYHLWLSNTLNMPLISFVSLWITFMHVLRTSRYYGYHSDHLFIIMYVSPFYSYLLRLSMLLRDAQNPFFIISNAYFIFTLFPYSLDIYSHPCQGSP